MNTKRRALKSGTNSYSEQDLHKKAAPVSEPNFDEYEEIVITYKCNPLRSFTYTAHGIVQFKKTYEPKESGSAPQVDTAASSIVKEEPEEMEPIEVFVPEEAPSTIETTTRPAEEDAEEYTPYISTIEDLEANSEHKPPVDMLDALGIEELTSTIEEIQPHEPVVAEPSRSKKKSLKKESKQKGEFNKSKLRKPKVNLFETVVDERELLKEQIYEKINHDGYYNEIKPEDSGVEFVHKEKKKMPSGTIILIVALTIFAFYMIISNVIGLTK